MSGRLCVWLAIAGLSASVQVSRVESPVVSGSTVTFIAGGDPSDPPRIVGDFNGWTGGEMTPANGDGRTWRLAVNLEPTARIEYLIAYRDRFVRDPANPLTIPAPAGPPRSELRMPEYRPPPPLPDPKTRGSVNEFPFRSRGGEQRRIRVYVPARHAGRLPIVYALDGAIFAETLALPAMLDSLIEANRIAPALVVFVDAIDRHDDYEPASTFRRTLLDEIVPTVESRYGVADAHRSLLGLSRSTVGALDSCAHSTTFDACALVAPAIATREFAAVLPARGSRTRVLIRAGTYDVPLITDARLLHQALVDRGVPVSYSETPEGHNRTAFRTVLPGLLAALLGA